MGFVLSAIKNVSGMIKWLKVSSDQLILDLGELDSNACIPDRPTPLDYSAV